MPVSLSLEVAVRSKPPLAAFGSMKIWVPVPE